MRHYAVMNIFSDLFSRYLLFRLLLLFYKPNSWCLLQTSSSFKSHCHTKRSGTSVSGGGKGRCMPPGGTVQDAAFGGAKIWNYEIWPLLANWRLHCRQWYFYTPNTPPVLRPHPLTVGAPRPHTKQCVHQETYGTLLIWLIIHLL